MKTRKLAIIIALLMFPILSNAQKTEKKPSIEKDFQKHEIGISWGGFPLSGAGFANDSKKMISLSFIPSDDGIRDGYFVLVGRHPSLAHHKYINQEYGYFDRYDIHYSMHHFGTLTFNYQYHFTSKHSIGFTFSWLGRHIQSYLKDISYGTMPGIRNDNILINSTGWEHDFTLCANYRFTYYNKNALSLYTGIHVGVGLGFIERKLLLPAEYNLGFNSYAFLGMQLTALGIEVGKTHAFISELGFGVQGIIKVGYRYKFNSKRNCIRE